MQLTLAPESVRGNSSFNFQSDLIQTLYINRHYFIPPELIIG